MTDEIKEYILNAAETAGLNEEQTAGLINACDTEIACSIITGGPGRGKSFLIRVIAETNIKLNKNKIVICAPTGKAVARLKELGVKATEIGTIDSLLSRHGLLKDPTTNETRSCNKDILVIIDEASMLGTVKMAQVMRMYPDARMILVGDTDQLPPISAGQIFKNMIAAGVPTVKLQKCMRNGGNILANLDKIVAGNKDLVYDERDFDALEVPDDGIARTTTDLYLEALEANDHDFSKVAMISPLNKGESGVWAMNLKLHNIINPEEKWTEEEIEMLNNMPVVYENLKRTKNYQTHVYDYLDMTDNFNSIIIDREGLAINHTDYKGTKLRIGDYVMFTENAKIPTFDEFISGEKKNADDAESIANGDTGIITGITMSRPESITLLVKVNDTVFAVNSYTKLDLAYCISAHKSQGSEYNTVIFISCSRMGDPDLFKSCGFNSRNIVYTALSRAQKSLMIVGDADALESCIDNVLTDGTSDLSEMIA